MGDSNTLSELLVMPWSVIHALHAQVTCYGKGGGKGVEGGTTVDRPAPYCRGDNPNDERTGDKTADRPAQATGGDDASSD